MTQELFRPSQMSDLCSCGEISIGCSPRGELMMKRPIKASSESTNARERSSLSATCGLLGLCMDSIVGGGRRSCNRGSKEYFDSENILVTSLREREYTSKMKLLHI